MNQAPRHLHRYRSFAEGSRGYLERTVVHSELFFPRPVDFNDPFDCRPAFTLGTDTREKRKYYEGVLSRRTQLSRTERRQEARAMVKNPARDPARPDNLHGFQQRYQDAVTQRIGVLCLSEVADDILMWAHYANSHKGICLVFDHESAFFAPSQPVIYQSDRPIVNPVRQSYEQMMEHALLTKSDHWSYEREWRLIHYQKGSGVYVFPESALVGVILGAQLLREEGTIVKNWALRRSTPLQLFQARLSTEKFAVSIEPIAI